MKIWYQYCHFLPPKYTFSFVIQKDCSGRKDTHALSPVLPSAHPLQVITYLNSNLFLMIGPCFSWAVFLWYPQLLFRLTNRWSLISCSGCWLNENPHSLWRAVWKCAVLFSVTLLQCDFTAVPLFWETVFSSLFLSGETRVLGTHPQAYLV